MFRALFSATLFVALVVNLIFLFATKNEPPDASGTTYDPIVPSSQTQPKRLFLRSNNDDLGLDYPTQASNSIEQLSVSAPEVVAANETSARSDTFPRKPKVLISGYLKHTKRRLDRPSNESDTRSETIRSEPPTRVMNIRVKSSKERVSVSVNDLTIYRSNPDEDQRGMHVIVLNEFYGYTMAERIFDTYSAGQDEELCYFINMIRDGRILVMAVQDEASFKMAPHSPARQLLSKLGSEHIFRLGWRDSWAFVVRKSTQLETSLAIGQSRSRQRILARQQNNFGEMIRKSAKFSDWAPDVILETRVPLTSAVANETSGRDPTSLACGWSSGERHEDRRRLEFCSRIEGYARVCDCEYPLQIDFAPAKINNFQLEGVPILVMASNRPHYLYRMLRSLLAADGVNRSMVVVFIDGFYEEPKLISELFSVRVQQLKPRAERSARISHHYRSSLTRTFDELFPSAEFAIIFEEDLDVAQDAIAYFSQTADLLRRDESLYCVSAWNDQGYEHSTGDRELLYRVETMPGLGWMLSRRLYKEELELQWPGVEQPHDWDMWIRTDPIRRDRECIVPDVSRTFHFGSVGTNMNSYFQSQYFSKHAFVPFATRTRFRNIDKLTRDEYESHLEELLAGSQVHKVHTTNSTSESLCSLANKPDDYKKGTSSVIFLEMIDERDHTNWLKLANCWRIWDLDARGQHKSMWRLFIGGEPVFVVGAPASPYAKFKPPDIRPFSFSTSTRSK